MIRGIFAPVLVALMSATALAQTAAPGPGSGTGTGVDLATFQSRQRARLMRADADHDGRVSQAEWSAWWAAHPGKGPANPARRFRRLDTNGDGFLAVDEIDAASAKRFAHLDADHDGHVSHTERTRRPD